MKKTIIITLISIILQQLPSYACDICGCGASTSYIGILPEYQHNFIGARYRYNSLLSHLDRNGATTYMSTDERFHTAELWGAFHITPSWRLIATLPYSFIQKTEKGQVLQTSGLSDMSLGTQYRLWQRKISHKDKLWIFDSWAGANIKAPSGKYNNTEVTATNPTNNLFQLGTGSWDFQLQGILDIRYQDVGLNWNVSYKINTTNRYDYYYGNKAATSLVAYYKWGWKMNHNLVPNAGINFEHTQRDIRNEMYVDVTGGYVLRAVIGVESRLSRFFWGAQWQPVLQQQIGTGATALRQGFVVHSGLQL